MTIKKLARMPYAQAHVEISQEGDIYLFSYVTLVCAIQHDESGEGWLTCTGTYSQTTRKHIGAFMHEYVKYPNGSEGCYQDAKACYEGNYSLNLVTGEIELLK